MVRAPRWATILCALSFAVLLLTARTRCRERSRLIQNEDGVVANDGAGNPDTLPLPTGQCFPALTDHSVVAVRHLRDELIRIGQFCGFQDLRFSHSRLAESNIVAHRSLEEPRFLQHVTDLVA